MSRSLLLLAFVLVAPVSSSFVAPAFAKQPICKEKIRQFCYEQQRSEDPMECVMYLESEYLAACEELTEPKQREDSIVLWCIHNEVCNQQHGDGWR